MSQSDSRPMMSLPEAIAQCLRKYVGFSGRATRAEHWWWDLAITAIFSVFGLLVSLLPVVAVILFVPVLLFALAILLPTLAVTVRRLHDIGKSGWWILAWIIIAIVSGFIMLAGYFLASGLTLLGDLLGEGGLAAIGYVVLVVGLAPYAGTQLWIILWLARQGDAGPNRHGPDPRAT